MLKEFKNKKLVKNEKGLTLVELLAVIVILAIISAIAIPAIGNIIENSRYNAVKADAINVLNAAQLYYTDNPEGEKDTGGIGDTTEGITVEQLKVAGYLENIGKIAEATDAKVTITNPKKLTASNIKYSNSKTITFTSATIEDINKDTNKGSGKGGYTIPAAK